MFLLMSISAAPVIGLNIIQSPPGLPDFYVNDDWSDLENGTVVIDDFIIDYIIGVNAFAKIQDAIDKCNMYYKEIFVFQGTYNESIVVKSGLDKAYVELRGIYGWEDPDGDDPVMINGVTAEDAVVTIEAEYIDLHGFTITNNENTCDGIVVKGNFAEIYDNVIENIGGTGVLLTESTFLATIRHNNFINNGVNAEDNSLPDAFCEWDNGEEGNYWDDYKERYPFARPRLLKPWIWNTPYDIDGGDNKDRYPLIGPYPDVYITTYPGTQTNPTPNQQSTPRSQQSTTTTTTSMTIRSGQSSTTR